MASSSFGDGVVVKRLAIFAIAGTLLVAGCQRPPPVEQTPLKPQSPAELQSYIVSQKPNVEVFRPRGPFAYETLKNHVVRVSPTERVVTDFFLSKTPERAGLVIFMHGYDVAKEAHEHQAQHVASWGMHALTVQLPKRGQWVQNGKTLQRMTELLQRIPALLSDRIDGNRIVLVGHSFGAISVTSALADGAPAVGGVLLDPAGVGRDLPKILQRVQKPLVVLGADSDVGSTRNREWFYRYPKGRVAEVSIRDATHEDAQYPSQTALDYGIDPYTTEEAQLAFIAALTSAALSLASTGTFEQAWQTYTAPLQNGKFFNPRKR